MSSAAERAGICLHLVVGPGGEALEQCLAQFRPGDSLLFLDAGVTNLLREAALLEGVPGTSVLYSSADLAARGLLEPARKKRVSELADPAFFDLLARHDFCLTWK